MTACTVYTHAHADLFQTTINLLKETWIIRSMQRSFLDFNLLKLDNTFFIGIAIERKQQRAWQRITMHRITNGQIFCRCDRVQVKTV